MKSSQPRPVVPVSFQSSVLVAFLVSGLVSMSGCAAICIGGALGGAAGYEAAKHGYKVQSPVRRDGEGNLEVHSPVTKAKDSAQ
ncbi:MAG: hypothetical protein V2A77_08285 [Pseudomonadota bacterium]